MRLQFVGLAFVLYTLLGCDPAAPSGGTANPPDSSTGGTANQPDAAAGGRLSDASAGMPNREDAGDLVDSGDPTDSGDSGPSWNPGSVLHDADQVAIAKLHDPVRDDDASTYPDAGQPFHGIQLATEFTVASDSVESEMLQLLSSPETYMSDENGCFAEQVAVRIRTPDGNVDVIVGLHCWIAHFYLPDGTRRSRYFYPGTIQQFADLAHEVVPAIDDML